MSTVSVNNTLLHNLKIRDFVIQAIREYFQKEDFLEVMTPLLVPSVIPESYLEYFQTNLLDRNRKAKKMFLTASPESSLKILLSAGSGNIFEITKSFRNTENFSDTHNPEFTMLEWYKVGADYKDMMEDVERLILYVFDKIKYKIDNRKKTNKEIRSQKLALSGFIPSEAEGVEESKFKNTSKNSKIENSQYSIEYQARTINLQPPWERISIIQALRKYSNIDFDEITDKSKKDLNEIFVVNKISPVAQKKGYCIDRGDTWEKIFNQIYLNEIEPHLGVVKPTIIYDFPAPMAALAKLNPKDTRLSQRFELYIAGLELADCYSELTDDKEQKKRFENEQALRKKMNKINVPTDRQFLKSLKKGLPDCSGTALGIDRLVMLFCDTGSIKNTNLFID